MHKSVLVDEALEFLKPMPGSVILDATLGGGGHAEQILKKIVPQGKLIGIDCDKNTLQIARERLNAFETNIHLVHGNFRNLDTILDNLNIEKIDGALFDLGVSSFQLDNAERGFSFKQAAELDMRMDDTANFSAYNFINKASEYELDEAIKNYGEERYHKSITRAIAQQRKKHPIETTTELAQIIYENTPARYRKFKIDPATRTFQAVRIAVNDELKSLQGALEKITPYLGPGARLVVISFNSLEDRIVKRNFKAMDKNNIYKNLTKKPLTPKEAEINQNPRARSAKLRAAEKNV